MRVSDIMLKACQAHQQVYGKYASVIVGGQQIGCTIKQYNTNAFGRHQRGVTKFLWTFNGKRVSKAWVCGFLATNQ